MTDPHATPRPPAPAAKSRLRFVTIATLAIFIAIGAAGIASRAADARRLKQTTDEAALPTVAVMTAQKGAVTQTLDLPGTIQAWHEAVIYARTGGYLKDWKVDIGAKVKQGDVLADIDAPDLDAQFRQAQADLATAIANNNIAQLTARRYATLRKTDSVSQQQADTAQAAADADAAAVNSAKANLDHLQQEEDFKQVVAPFDGTITARNTDVGALVIGESNGTGQDLFHIADTGKLRIYVQVPENDAASITPDIKAELHFPERPADVVPATLSHMADALDPTNRTLMLEFDVDNADGRILAGGYTDVHITIPGRSDTVVLPVGAMLFRDVPRVATVDDKGVATLHKVKIGRDYGRTIEITDGIAPGDRVIVNPPDSLQDGERVRIVGDAHGDNQPAK
ncbi:MAG: efflux RND transporter periplasmic adaptor subunit [Alphaproteobacteria bacterium]|nr:efflux RND transporter periplasmic adaptor subunit [Alphaproteobacteria bacterium]